MTTEGEVQKNAAQQVGKDMINFLRVRMEVWNMAKMSLRTS